MQLETTNLLIYFSLFSPFLTLCFLPNIRYKIQPIGYKTKIITRTVPSQETLDYFVQVYKLSTKEESKAEFINQYEKEGRTYVIIRVENKICDLPLLSTSTGWTANGVSCK